MTGELAGNETMWNGTLRANAGMASAAAARGVEVRDPATGDQPARISNKHHRKRDTSFAILRILEDVSPAFCWPRAPLAIGIDSDLQELLVDEYKPHQIQHFLRWYCGTHDYLEAVAAGCMRLALDGTPTEPPTDEHRADARQRLDARVAKQGDAR
jgi:sRNA-binding protein